MNTYLFILWGRYLESQEDIYIKGELQAESQEDCKEKLENQIKEENTRETIQVAYVGVFEEEYTFDKLLFKIFHQSNGKVNKKNHHIYVEFIDEFIHFLEDIYEKNIPIEESEYGKGIVKPSVFEDEHNGEGTIELPDTEYIDAEAQN